MRDAVTEESLKRNKKKRISIGEKIGVEKGAKERQPLWIINDDWGEKGQMDEGPPPSLPTRPIRRGKTQPWALFFSSERAEWTTTTGFDQSGAEYGPKDLHQKVDRFGTSRG